MISLPLASECRLSGESLEKPAVLLDVAACPVPGVYPADRSESVALRTPLRVVQAPGSGLVQLAHAFDHAIYRRYGFAGATSAGYRAYLESFADALTAAFPRDAAVLEVGCGDGTLLAALERRGFAQLLGIDPGLPARAPQTRARLVHGYFPDDLPEPDRTRPWDAIVLRHVLEHVEKPRAFVDALARGLAPGGQLWIEVPDLASTVRRGLWGNFYQLHCNYFEAATLDALAAGAGLGRVGAQWVDVFGGSILHRYTRAASAHLAAPTRWTTLEPDVEAFRGRIRALADRLPAPCVGYGAAERTAATVGFCPELAERLDGLCDANPHLAGRFLGGTPLRIAPKAELFARPPASILLLAISHRPEILADLRAHLPGETLVAVAGEDFACGPLAALADTAAAAGGGCT
jgi:SAM-dependent methyltransferase